MTIISITIIMIVIITIIIGVLVVAVVVVSSSISSIAMIVIIRGPTHLEGILNSPVCGLMNAQVLPVVLGLLRHYFGVAYPLRTFFKNIDYGEVRNTAQVYWI